MADQMIVSYRTAPEAARAVDHLVARGIPQSDVSVLMSDSTYGTHFSVKDGNKAEEGVGAGATIGGTLGAIAAAGAAAAGLAIPGVGFLAAGPIMATFAGGGAGALAGGAVGGLVGIGLPEHEAKLHEEVLKDEGVLVGVNVEEDGREDIVKGLEDITDPIRVTTV